MEEIMLKIDNVKKKYILGQIGGTTLRDEIQRLGAKIKHQEDPTKRIGAKDYNKGETFMALNGVTFEVKKGERIGIIGHNGAGKSTLLKLISRVTAPSDGIISMNGKVASMLEVGTGFHPELTGRENIYMNGAILGMTKKEIDEKMEDIIEFSECRQFIDTPVKRYSSGMYVKLAFSVAAHLDSEILIMDEVLAVGDMAFQKKCLDKMNDVSKKDGRTILYVSHNMNTIRQLCDRCVVLSHGQVIFDGDVEEAIEVYFGIDNNMNNTVISFCNSQRQDFLQNNNKINLYKFELLDKEYYVFKLKEHLKFRLWWESYEELKNLCLRVKITSSSGTPVGGFYLDSFMDVNKGLYCKDFEIDLDELMYGKYSVTLVFSYTVIEGRSELVEAIVDAFGFEIQKEETDLYWPSMYWGATKFNNIKVIE